jgi:acetate kinase
MTPPLDSTPRSLIVFNVGSSSLKYQLFAFDGTLVGEALAHGNFERHASVGGTDEPSPADIALLSQALEEAEKSAPGRPISAAGHRVVHGGRVFLASILVDASQIEKIAALSDLAPLHQPHNLMAIRALAKLRPDLPQVAAFDTAFHRTMPLEARRLPLPDWVFEAGIERYGFHGLSYAWLVEALRARRGGLPARVLAFHLGSGASACAIVEGRSVDTSMSFSTLDGLMMASRPGALDPGVLLHLMRTKNMDAGQLTDLLYGQSGLAGVSGLTGDMRTLLASREPSPKLAIALYCRRAGQIGAGLAAMMGGIDAVVFTGGVGENAAPIRSEIASFLTHLGVRLDEAANRSGGEVISPASAKIDALVVPANEERIIAQEMAAILKSI